MKYTKRKGFNFFRSYYDVYNMLTNDKDRLSFIEALLDKQFLGVNPENLSGMVDFAWVSQVNSIDSQVKGWEDKTGLRLDPPVGGVGRGENNPALQVEGKGKEEEKEKERDFSEFWDSFHSLTGKPKTDMQPAKKHWEKLTAEEKVKAISFIPQYSSSNIDKRYLKKARTYLSDKNFNDEIVGAKKTVVDDQGKERKIAFTRPDGSVVYEPTTNPTLEQIKAERV
tara:strand:- start:1177 stop:1851 length:675 start_codon:yes stop_codon:yes gene_type:complete